MQLNSAQRISTINSGAETSPDRLCLPDAFPFLAADQLSSSSFWPAASPAAMSPEEDMAYLRSVLSAPTVTTMRAVVPLRMPAEHDDGDGGEGTAPKSGDERDALQQQGTEQRRRSRREETTTAEATVSKMDAQINGLAANMKHFSDALASKNFVATCDSFFPDVLFVRKAATKRATNNILTSSSSASAADATSASSAPSASSTQQQSTPRVTVIVDAGCGEAVLRGSDVFAPGVLAATADFGKGQNVTVAAVISATQPVGNCGLQTNSVLLSGAFVKSDFVKANCVIVAENAVCEQSRADVFKAKRTGLAFSVTDPEHPSLSLLQQIASQRPASCYFTPFLQNLSSMVPAPLLMEIAYRSHFLQQQQLQQRKATRDPIRICDTCAAPGGKSSHILSYCALLGLTAHDVRLVCIERSPGRAAQLKQLLTDHHGTSVVSSSVLVVAADANAIVKPNSAEHLAISKFLGFQKDNKNGNSENDDATTAAAATATVSTALFDVVLCDPPCTGLGLRPRLRPFGCDQAAIDASADYQRKLVTTAAALLRSGGILSYSTCTTSLMENEMNVAALSATTSSLRCMRIQELPEKCQRMMKMMTTTTTAAGGSVRCSSDLVSRFMAASSSAGRDDTASASASAAGDGDGDDINAKDFAVWRFGPASPPSSCESSASKNFDGVGFFLALFQKN